MDKRRTWGTKKWHMSHSAYLSKYGNTLVTWHSLFKCDFFLSQVLKLFEQFDAPDYVIRVAHIALDLAAPDDPNIVSITCS